MQHDAQQLGKFKLPNFFKAASKAGGGRAATGLAGRGARGARGAGAKGAMGAGAKGAGAKGAKGTKGTKGAGVRMPKVSTKAKLTGGALVAGGALLTANSVMSSRRRRECVDFCSDFMNGPGTDDSPVCTKQMNERQCRIHCDSKCSKLHKSVINVLGDTVAGAGGGLSGLFGSMKRVLVVVLVVLILLMLIR